MMRALFLILAAMTAMGAVAQSSSTAPSAPLAPLRDPTRPPAAYASAQHPVAAPVSVAPAFQPQYVLTVDGVRYLVWNGRRYRVGDTIEGARIERIGESEIWLQGAEGKRKLSLYSGIEKRPPRDAAANPVDEAAEAAKGKKGHKK